MFVVCIIIGREGFKPCCKLCLECSRNAPFAQRKLEVMYVRMTQGCLNHSIAAEAPTRPVNVVQMFASGISSQLLSLYLSGVERVLLFTLHFWVCAMASLLAKIYLYAFVCAPRPLTGSGDGKRTKTLRWQSKLLSCPQWSSSCVLGCGCLLFHLCAGIICSELMDSLDKDDDIIYCNANAET